MIRPRCGDHVFHKPSRETWVVAWCDGKYLSWCGWPPGEVPVSECLLVDRATDEDFAELANRIVNNLKGDYMARRVRSLYPEVIQ